MTNETTRTSFNDTEFAAWIAEDILEENRPYNVMRPFFRYHGPEKSNAVDFPIQDDPGAAGASYTEGTGLSNTQLSSSKATATAVSTGMMATITDELMETTVISDVYGHFSRVLGRSVMERFETDGTALLDDFANTTNVAATPLTYALMLEAINQLEQRDQTGQAVAVLDPAQVGAIRQDIGSSGAAVFGHPSAVDVGGIVASTLGGYAGFNIGQVPVFQTSLVTSTGGAVFLAGVALGLYEIRPLRVEAERDASMPGTELVATTRYGMIEIRDVAGETVLI